MRSVCLAVITLFCVTVVVPVDAAGKNHKPSAPPADAPPSYASLSPIVSLKDSYTLKGAAYTAWKGSGFLNLDGTKFISSNKGHALEFTGSLNAKSMSIEGSMKITGPVFLQDGFVEKNAEVRGALISKGAIFKGDLHVVSPTILQGNKGKSETNNVNGRLQVDGDLIARDLEAGALYVNGMTFIRDSFVKAETKLNGYLVAKNTTFKGPMTINSSDLAVFTDCNIQSIEMGSPATPGESQTIDLHKNTRVNGDITFTSGNGKVVIHPGCTFKGTLKGGRAVRTN